MALLPVLPIFDIRNQARKKRSYPLRADPLGNLDDGDFFDRFRFRKDTFQHICDLIRPDLTHKTHRNSALSPELQLCCALRFYASGSFLEVVGDTVRVSRSSASRTVTKISTLLAQKLDDFVKFPSDAEIKTVQNDFYEIARVPGIVGAIDGTHIKIQAPASDQEPFYVNRKGYHSINVQGICDAKYRFLNIVADWPGSAHDSRILQMSHIGSEFSARRQKGILLGDSGYACSEWLLTPLLAPKNLAEERYNRAHKVTRCIVERTFGIWKRRFHVLHSEIRMDPRKVCHIIGACAVLHNIATRRGDLLPNQQDVQGDDDSDSVDDIVAERSQHGSTFRQNYIQNYFTKS